MNAGSFKSDPPGSTFRIFVGVPKRIPLGERTLSRDEFFDWLWAEFGQHTSGRGLVGVHEGTLLSEDAAKAGLETDSWTVDSGEAPRERDWVGDQNLSTAELYFDSRPQADQAAEVLREAGFQVTDSEEQQSEDWDAQWKASFQGAEIPPFWKIIPPWVEANDVPGEMISLKINPGAGFGTGTHETTQLCLQAIAEADQRMKLWGEKALDFGSGSGILSIGMALLGAQVDGIEIDPLAVENAVENAKLNAVAPMIRWHDRIEGLKGEERYPLVVANILRPVLIEFAPILTSRMKPAGTMILSGLIERDLVDVRKHYDFLLGRRPEIKEQGEWRALVYRP